VFLSSPFFERLTPKLPWSNCTGSSHLLFAKVSDKFAAWLVTAEGRFGFCSPGAGKPSPAEGVEINAFVMDRER